MYAITGITGQVGGAVANSLLAAGKNVRAVLRDPLKGESWKANGAEIVVADIEDAAALTAAFSGVEGVFVIIPPLYDPSEGYPEVRAILAAVHQALAVARPPKVVYLSTIGAEAEQPNVLTQLGIMEQGLSDLPMPIAFLRAGWFMENASWDVATVRNEGILYSFLQPLDRPIAMVAVQDIGALAAELLQETWQGQRIVELEGPERVSPKRIAAAFASALGRPVSTQVIARDIWHELFVDQGMNHPTPRIRMLDGFNEGWIDFQPDSPNLRKGTTRIDSVIAELVARG
jgi:NAD(P)H dehydrogenase (quinone)